jgi:hypothetical protein
VADGGWIRAADNMDWPVRALAQQGGVAMIFGAMRRIAVVSALLTVVGLATTLAAVSATGATQPQHRQIAVTTLSRFKVVLTITRSSRHPLMGTVTAAGYRRAGTHWKLISRKRIGKANGWFWFSTETCSLTTTQLKGAAPTRAVDSITVRLLITPAVGCSGPISKTRRP